MKQEKKKVFISFGDSMKNSLHAGAVDVILNSEEELDYHVINIGYLLECGDVSNVPFSAAEIYSNLFFTKTEEIVKKANDALKELRSYDDDSEIEIFVYGNKGNDVCNLYYFAEEFMRFANARVHFCNIVPPEKSTLPRRYASVDRSIKLSKEKIESFSRKWKELALSNSALRVSRGGEIVEYSLEQAIEKVLSVFTKEYERFPTLYLKLLDACSADEQWSYVAFVYITYMLVKNGVVERTADTNTQSGCSDIFFEQKFRIV